MAIARGVVSEREAAAEREAYSKYAEREPFGLVAGKHAS